MFLVFFDYSFYSSSKHHTIPNDLIVMDFAKAFDHPPPLQCCPHHHPLDQRLLKQQKPVSGDRRSPVTATTCHIGSPQDTVLGPALFLCYINSMPEGISSSIRLFAADTVVYRQITSAADHAILSQDLQKLARWEAEYSMEFHQQKCNVLRVTRSRSPSIFNYTLHGTTLKSTESTAYLGVTLTKDLTWGIHVDNFRAKANRRLAVVRRNIRTVQVQRKRTCRLPITHVCGHT